MKRDWFPIWHPNGSGWIAFDDFEEGGRRICGVFMLIGGLNLPPKQWLKVVRETMAGFERRAKLLGFDEMRVSERDWSRILIGYERIQGDAANLLRKRL